MEPPFYHVDRRGDLSVGDTLNLNWDLQIYGKNETPSVDSQYVDQMKEDFQRGLSSHGARYAHAYYEINHNPDYYLQHSGKQVPTPVLDSDESYIFIKNGINEWLAERTRRDSFSDQRSRLQSYFAWPNKGAIDGFGDDDYSVYEVEPADFELRDMRLLDSAPAIQDYWRGKLTAQPKPEIMMEGPVEILDDY